MADQRILLVEQEPVARKRLIRIVADAGYVVDASSNTSTARGLLARKTYGLVITDGRLPSSIVIDAAIRSGGMTAMVSNFRFLPRPREINGIDTMLRPVRPGELLADVERHIGKAAFVTREVRRAA